MCLAHGLSCELTDSAGAVQSSSADSPYEIQRKLAELELSVNAAQVG